MFNTITHDLILLARSLVFANCKQELSVKRSFQQLANFLSFRVVRKVCCEISFTVRLSLCRMLPSCGVRNKQKQNIQRISEKITWCKFPQVLYIEYLDTLKKVKKRVQPTKPEYVYPFPNNSCQQDNLNTVQSS